MTLLANARRLVLIVGGLAALIGASPADEKGDDRRQRYAALKAEYDQKHAAFVTAAEAKPPAADPASLARLRPSAEEYGRRFLDLARADPTDAVGCDALAWVAAHGRPGKDLDAALDLLQKHHLASPKLKGVVVHLGMTDSAAGLIDQLVEKGGSRDVRGLAGYFAAVRRYAAYCMSRKSDPKELEAVTALLERVTKDYADVRVDDRTAVGPLVEGWLFEAKHLQPGMAAPDISGDGVDGKRMKLSDHRGKVVLLVFWSSGCGLCLAEVPQHRKLTADFAGRPFTVVGVCCGDGAERAAKTMKDEKMAWPSFLDGDLGEGGICQKWNVEGLPTVYLIDAGGVIVRNRSFDPQERSDRALVEAAVRKAERNGK